MTTADGFVLGVYRIPHGRTEAAGSRGGTSGGGAGTSAGGSSSSEGSVGSGGEPVRHSSVGSVRRALSDSDGAGPSAADGAAAARPPVLLWHGLLDSSAAWVLNEPDESLGFILADAGYDVWMGEQGRTAWGARQGALPVCASRGAGECFQASQCSALLQLAGVLRTSPPSCLRTDRRAVPARRPWCSQHARQPVLSQPHRPGPGAARLLGLQVDWG